MKAAIESRRMVFTLDRSFGDLARTSGIHAGVVVFRLPKQDAKGAVEVVGRFVEQFYLADLADSLVVVQPDRVRIRKPD